MYVFTNDLHWLHIKKKSQTFQLSEKEFNAFIREMRWKYFEGYN